MPDDRLPTNLYVDAHLKTLTDKAVYYYFHQKGNPSSGLILVKLANLKGQAKLRIQERDFIEDKMIWVDALDKETLEEADVDAYIRRAIDRDPDLWVIEIEDTEMNNPFEA